MSCCLNRRGLLKGALGRTPGFSGTPKGSPIAALGWAVRATVGETGRPLSPEGVPQFLVTLRSPQWMALGVGQDCATPSALYAARGLPLVGPPTASQPWALLRNPSGVGNTVLPDGALAPLSNPSGVRRGYV